MKDRGRETRGRTAAKMLALFAKRRRHAAALAIVVDASGALTVCSSVTHRAAVVALLRDALETVDAGDSAELAAVDAAGKIIERAAQSSSMVH